MLLSVGLNRRLATVEDREVVALAEEDLAPALAGWAALDGVEEVAVISTCRRVEIYAIARWPGVASAALRSALSARAGRDLPLVELHGREAFRHLVRVASSLESAILGEPRILRQVTDAFARAAEAGAAGPALSDVLARVLAAAGRVRAETAIGRAGVSWGHAAACLAGKVLGDLRGRRALILGAGEMARLTAQHLAAQGSEVTVLNRSVGRAEAVAAEVGGRAGGLDALERELLGADLVVSAAPVAPDALGPAAVAALMARRCRPLVLVDLAVPRAVPVATGDLDEVYLCDVDDLDRVMHAAQAGRASAVVEAERIVEAEVERYARAEAERLAVPVIRELRTRAQAIAREEVERTVHRGRDGEALLGAAVAMFEPGPAVGSGEATR